MPRIENLHIAALQPLSPPQAVKAELPESPAALETVLQGRSTIQQILAGKDPRLLIVIGPCSIHDPAAALEYAQRLSKVAKDLAPVAAVVMRVYFEKPRTTIGWKGLINDPHLDGSCDVESGLKIARKLLSQINELGIPAATEFLDPIIPQYIADLVSWAAIGARTTESQTHRELASGLSMPVGFKNGTDGSLQVAIDAMIAAQNQHSFLGIDQKGATCIVRTQGNPWGHVVLRGGRNGSNYDAESLQRAAGELEKHSVSTKLMIDCSHANSGKQFARQEIVWDAVLAQKVSGNRNIMGIMVESHLQEGSQPIKSRAELQYGVSITDSCLGWETTERLLRKTADLLQSTPAR
jgi:3-deoxy-7-phosphoheptulonate synthase